MNVSVDYRLTSPLRLDVRFEIRGFTALLGRSGAGKTSLLKALAGLLPAAGPPWQDLPPQARPVGYVPQGAAIFPHLTVLQNAAYGARGRQRLAVAQALLDDLGIGHLASRPGGTISGGEAQRLALARALARAPRLLLLDEPSAALDAVTRDAVLMQLIGIIGDRQIPALAATHDFAVAGLADWVVLLAGGRIIQQGPPGPVFEAPATIEAAQLLGYQNFFTRAGVSYAIHAADIRPGPGVAAVITGIRPDGAGLRLTCAMPEPVTLWLPQSEAGTYRIGQTIELALPADKVRALGGEPG